MEREHRDEKLVMVRTASSATEAMVNRGLLDSAGIASPDLSAGDPFPIGEAIEGFHNAQVFALESQAEKARQIIAVYLKSNEGVEVEDSGDEPDGEPIA